MNTKTLFDEVEKSLEVKAEAAFSITSFDLKGDAADKDIEDMLPDEHLFKVEEVYILVGALIGKQSKGEDGSLITTGYANLFYTPSYVVDVRWGECGWGVYAVRRDVRRWFARSRVFSPAN